MISFTKSYKDKIITKIKKCFLCKKSFILNFKYEQNKIDLVVVSEFGIFLFNIYDVEGIIDEGRVNEKLWFVMKPDEEKIVKSNKENNKPLNLTKTSKLNTLTIPFDSQIDKVTIINPYLSLNKTKDYILKLIKSNYDEINVKKFPIYVIPIFDKIKNIDEYEIYNLKKVKTLMKSLDNNIDSYNINAYSSLLKIRS